MIRTIESGRLDILISWDPRRWVRQDFLDPAARA